MEAFRRNQVAEAPSALFEVMRDDEASPTALANKIHR